ncbi:MAG TPA: molybdopterin cofactor-binding domain-containing protein, partial [Stellaceae bacterium]|nr:molybdopterin cofactor-binding domain-containing protein [Stellaceae bacterium]
MTKPFGVGARVARKEDDRHLRGRGQFVGDMTMPGMREVAFLRSPVAHARILRIEIPDELRARVFVAADLVGVKPIRAVSGLPGFKVSEQPVLATGKVRYVGELIAACVAPTRAEAEDMAEQIVVEFDELPVVSDMLRARDADAPLVHEHWGDNVYLETSVRDDIAAVAAVASVKVTREFRTARQCMSPLEGKGVLAWWESRRDQLVVTTSTQLPHIVRTGLAGCLGLAQDKIRIVAPDVGGGFGFKGILCAEEVCVAFLARHLNRPLRWIEDRREQLTATANCREHHYRVTAYADREGKLLALDAEAIVDAGAYSIYPFSACLEAAQVASILPGPYVLPVYQCKTWSVAS